LRNLTDRRALASLDPVDGIFGVEMF